MSYCIEDLEDTGRVILKVLCSTVIASIAHWSCAGRVRGIQVERNGSVVKQGGFVVAGWRRWSVYVQERRTGQYSTVEIGRTVGLGRGESTSRVELVALSPFKGLTARNDTGVGLAQSFASGILAHGEPDDLPPWLEWGQSTLSFQAPESTLQRAGKERPRGLRMANARHS